MIFTLLMWQVYSYLLDTSKDDSPEVNVQRSKYDMFMSRHQNAGQNHKKS